MDADSHPMMRFMMQRLFDVSQAFNKSGRSKLLVPIDVALEGHFADDKIMKVCQNTNAGARTNNNFQQSQSEP